jgi:hypothetical protein
MSWSIVMKITKKIHTHIHTYLQVRYFTAIHVRYPCEAVLVLVLVPVSNVDVNVSAGPDP